ncbi:hypothetical protein [Halomicronema hongdechloris]|uniref:hypothetical protein n=1 Tax=Halomicronema hongdechloris TaxID=1209493 RepID=UPI0016519453|nr:hypothetical protein [Halomicronema hongdechloris]
MGIRGYLRRVIGNVCDSFQGNQGDNPVLNAFLDADGDSDVNMGDMMNMASRFL